ncbi:hypothetical protein GGU45_001009 [Niabella hirudinis]
MFSCPDKSQPIFLIQRFRLEQTFCGSYTFCYPPGLFFQLLRAIIFHHSPSLVRRWAKLNFNQPGYPGLARFLKMLFYKYKL